MTHTSFSSRRARWAAAATACCAATTLLLSGCGGSDAPTAALPDVAKYAPANTLVYAQLDTNIRSSQWRELRDMLGSWDDIQRAFDELADNPRAASLNRLLGGEMVLAVLPPKEQQANASTLSKGLDALSGGGMPDIGKTLGDDVDVVVALDVSARDAVADELTQELGTPDMVAGAPTWKQDDMYLARTADAMLAANSKEALAAALKAQGPSAAVHAAVLAQPADAMLAGAIDASQVQDPQLQMAAQTAGTAGFAVRPTTEALTITVSTEGGTALTQSEKFTPRLYKDLPASTSVYFGFANLAETVRQAATTAAAEDEKTKEQVAQLTALGPVLLGVSWDDLAALTANEHAFAAGGDKDAGWAGLMLEVKDTTRAEKTLDALGNGLVRVLTSQGVETQKALALRLGNVRLTGVKLQREGQDDMWVTWGIVADRAVIGIGSQAGLQDFASGKRLGDDPGFAEGIAPAPEQVSSLLWVNPERAATSMGASDDYLVQLRRGLDGIVGWSTGTRGELRLVRP